MSVVAVVRPDSWGFPLLLHVLGAMILVGGLLAGAAMLACARGEARSSGSATGRSCPSPFPGWVLMRIGAGGSPPKEGWDDLPKAWRPRLADHSGSSSPTSAG